MKILLLAAFTLITIKPITFNPPTISVVPIDPVIQGVTMPDYDIQVIKPNIVIKPITLPF